MRLPIPPLLLRTVSNSNFDVVRVGTAARHIPQFGKWQYRAAVEKTNDKVEAWAKALEAMLDPRQRGSVVTGADAEFVREQVAAIRSLKEELVKQNDIGRQQRDLLAQLAGRRAEQRPVDRQPQAASAP